MMIIIGLIIGFFAGCAYIDIPRAFEKDAKENAKEKRDNELLTCEKCKHEVKRKYMHRVATHDYLSGDYFYGPEWTDYYCNLCKPPYIKKNIVNGKATYYAPSKTFRVDYQITEDGKVIKETKQEIEGDEQN